MDRVREEVKENGGDVDFRIKKYLRDQRQGLEPMALARAAVCQAVLDDRTMDLKLRSRKDCYLFVLGVPNLAGAITASAEAGLQIIRLASVCPPSVLRPHFQEGYLLGEYPELLNYDQKKLMAHHEIDFGLRLIAKFKFKPGKLWADSNFKTIPKIALYPEDSHDPLRAIAEEVIILTSH